MSDESCDPKELFRIKTARELAAMMPRVLKFSWKMSPQMIIFFGAMTIVTALVPAASIPSRIKWYDFGPHRLNG